MSQTNCQLLLPRNLKISTLSVFSPIKLFPLRFNSPSADRELRFWYEPLENSLMEEVGLEPTSKRVQKWLGEQDSNL